MNTLIFNELSVAQDFHKKNPEILFSTVYNNYLVYENGVYLEQPKDHIRGLIQEYLISNNVDFKNAFVNAVLNTFKLLKSVSTDDAFEGNPYIINTRNCLIDVSYGRIEVKEHNPSYKTTVQLDVDYDKDAVATIYGKALNEILPDVSKRHYLLQYMAYCILHTYEFQKILMLKSGGRSGKGICIKPLQSILGVDNYMGLSIDKIATSNWAAAELHGKYLNVSSETKMTSINVDMLKCLSGGDLISSDRKFKGHLNFYNKAKLMILTNLTPRFTETNMAMTERIVVIEFTETFTGANDDTSLSHKITTEEEKSGVLNMMLDIMPSIFNSGSIRFLTPDVVQKDTDKLFKELDSVATFVDDNYEMDKSKKVLAYDFYTAYLRFCKTYGMVVYTKRHVYEKLREIPGVTVDNSTGNKVHIKGLAESL